jgi:6-pyruvoyl-tetrahydropterin synthase
MEHKKQQVGRDTREPEEIWALNELKKSGNDNPTRSMINLMIWDRLKESSSEQRFQLMSDVYSTKYVACMNALTIDNIRLQERVKLLESDGLVLSTETSERNVLLEESNKRLQEENEELRSRIRVLTGNSPIRVEVKPARRKHVTDNMSRIGGGI